MNERYSIPETVATLRAINNAGNDFGFQDAVVGIDIESKGVLSLGFRSLRPINIKDDNALIVELSLADILRAVALKCVEVVK